MSSNREEQVPGALTAEMYDDFSDDYDRFVDWEGRLTAEMPFLVRRLRGADARRVLDAACGTGMHAIALAKRGYEVVGADVSHGMIDRARANASDAGAEARFERAGFGELAQAFGPAEFDAVLCLGNSLPHVLTAESLGAAVDDFAACLRPGGLLLIQNRNFDAVLAERDRWMEPQSHREGETEWLFVRFYDFAHTGLLTFNVVRLQHEGSGDWSHRVTSTELWPQTRDQLTGALVEPGFEAIACFGDLQGAAFDPFRSPNLVVMARAGR